MHQISTHQLPNFEEETKGFTADEAHQEASRCLNCKSQACRKGCPVNNDIPGFVQAIKQKDYREAYSIIAKASNLPAICSRVCAHEKQCQSACVLNKKGNPINIGKLERFVADNEEHDEVLYTRPSSCLLHKVAVIGSGPAGLSAAGDLSRLGYDVTVFEAEEVLGGVLTHGIPEYRLPKQVVHREINKLENLGVNFVTKTIIGEDYSIDNLFEQGFEAIFIASGAGSPREFKIEGADLPGVMYANYFLATVNLVHLGLLRREEIPLWSGDKVAVIGAGNVAMDAARTAKRLGATDVVIVYRRGYDSIPALKSELVAAEEEGVRLLTYTAPAKILGTTRVTGLRCTRLVETENDNDPVIPEPDSEFALDVNRIILAIGQRPRSRIVSTTTDIDTNQAGYVVTLPDKFGYTTRSGVFAGGDVVTAPKTVVDAMKQGKAVAQEIHQYLQTKGEA